MCAEHRNLTWTLMLLFLAGGLCDTWDVEYPQRLICAVKGSTVVILCSFHPPDNQNAETVMWGHLKSHHTTARFISGSSLGKASRGFQYIGDTHHNCSLKIHQVEHNHAGKYFVRFINSSVRRRANKAGPTLKVVDLNILVIKSNPHNTVKEGDSVTLTCINSCDGGNLTSAFTWFKNGESMSEGPSLYLRSISSTNSGNYTCSLQTRTGTTSGAVRIDVEYAPKNTSVLVRPSMVIDAGGNFTLICSSHANPPVDSYTWFKIVGDEVLNVGLHPVFCPGDGGQYLCSAANKHGSQNSSVVTLNIKQYWATFPRGILIISTVAVLLTVSTVIAIRRFNKKRMRTLKVDCEEETQDTDYVNWLTCDNNQSQDRDQGEQATTEVVYAIVYFLNKRKSNTVQQQDSQNEEVIYSTVCRDQMLNPSDMEHP